MNQSLETGTETSDNKNLSFPSKKEEKILTFCYKIKFCNFNAFRKSKYACVYNFHQRNLWNADTVQSSVASETKTANNYFINNAHYGFLTYEELCERLGAGQSLVDPEPAVGTPNLQVKGYFRMWEEKRRDINKNA